MVVVVVFPCALLGFDIVAIGLLVVLFETMLREDVTVFNVVVVFILFVGVEFCAAEDFVDVEDFGVLFKLPPIGILEVALDATELSTSMSLSAMISNEFSVSINLFCPLVLLFTGGGIPERRGRGWIAYG